MIEIVIPYRLRSIGSFDVKRILPYSKRRSVGPFVFVDEMGPIEFVTDTSMDVLAHPHIGLSTVTYLFSGKMTHRDSLGTEQIIEPGEVNLMTAGRGIVHSERPSDANNPPGTKLAGLQTWLAMPENMEESAPDFSHHKLEDLPVDEGDGTYARVVLGRFGGMRSPVKTLLDPLYVECRLRDGQTLTIPADVEERSVYILQGSLLIDGTVYEAGNLPVFTENTVVELKAVNDTHFMIIGGPRLEKPRFMWWNFVSSSQELIEKARQDWKNGAFDPIPNDTGFVPLPENTTTPPIRR